MKESENETKKKQNCRHFRFEAKWSETEEKLFSLRCEKSVRKLNEAIKNEKEAKTLKRKRIKWNSGTICKETKKNIKVCPSVCQVYTY